MKTKIISGVQILILLLVSIGLSSVLGPCNGDMVMKCNYSVNVVKLLFATTILVKGIEIFVKEHAAVYFDIISVLLFADSILIPVWLVGGCQMADMACQSVAFPVIYITSIILILVNGISVLSHVWKKRGKDVV